MAEVTQDESTVVQRRERYGDVEPRDLGGMGRYCGKATIGLGAELEAFRCTCDSMGRWTRHHFRPGSALATECHVAQYQRLQYEACHKAFGSGSGRGRFRYRVAQIRPTRYLLQAYWRASRTRVSVYGRDAQSPQEQGI